MALQVDLPHKSFVTATWASQLPLPHIQVDVQLVETQKMAVDLLLALVTLNLDSVFLLVGLVVGPCLTLEGTAVLLTGVTFVDLLVTFKFPMRRKLLRAVNKGTVERQELGVLIRMGLQLMPLVEVRSTAFMATLVGFALVLVHFTHVVFHTGMSDKRLHTPFSLALVGLLPTVAELVFGEFVACAEVLITIDTWKGFQSCVFANMSF